MSVTVELFSFVGLSPPTTNAPPTTFAEFVTNFMSAAVSAEPNDMDPLMKSTAPPALSAEFERNVFSPVKTQLASAEGALAFLETKTAPPLPPLSLPPSANGSERIAATLLVKVESAIAAVPAD